MAARFRALGPKAAAGGPLSPLLANLYLHPLDRLLVAANIAAATLRDRGLRLHPDKTRIVTAAHGV